MTNEDVKKKRKTAKRSPGYPMLSLDESIQKAKILWDKDKNNPIPLGAAFEHLGYKTIGGYGGRVFSAMKQFGLIYQKKNDILVLNADNPKVKELSSQTKSKVYFFSDNSKAAAAIKVAKLLSVSDGQIKKVLSEFEGVPNRQEFIAEKRGVKYFNDTAATNPDSAIFGIKTFKQRFPAGNLILIAGGVDKKLNYADLALEIKKSVSCLVLLPGSASDILKKEISSLPAENLKIIPAGSMKEAVSIAEKEAKPGDIVLLSPAAASFNLFKNEFDRGDQFKEQVFLLKK